MKFLQKLNTKGFAHWIIPALVIVAIGGIGAYLVVGSHAATTAADYKVRFIAVIPKGDAVPAWATDGTVKDNALSIQKWYTGQVGKTFTIATADPLNYTMVRGSKTKAGYRTCPSGENCNGQASAAIVLNLNNEFSKPGYSTVIFTDIDPPVDGAYSKSVQGDGGVKDSDNYVQNYGEVAVQFAGSAGNYIGDAKSRRYAAHELGHTFGLNHVCDTTLMTAGGGMRLNGVDCKVATGWPDTQLANSQANNLSANSPFFNGSQDDTGSRQSSNPPLVTNNAPVRSSVVSLGTHEGCQLAGRVWDSVNTHCSAKCLSGAAFIPPPATGQNGYCPGAVQLKLSNGTAMTQASCNGYGRRWLAITGCSRKVSQTANTLGALQCINKSDTYYVPLNVCKP